MLILGLLLLACTAAFTGLLLADNLSGGPEYNVTVLDHHIATMNSLTMFAGLALALIFALGCVMALAGGALRRRRIQKAHAARKDARAIARERDELAARLAESGEPAGAASYPANEEPGRGSAGAAPGEPTGASRADTPRRRARHLFGH